LLAAMHDEKADGALFITTGKFSSSAIKYAEINKIEVFDRDHLPILGL
jgi:restriction endonuclease Mrr